MVTRICERGKEVEAIAGVGRHELSAHVRSIWRRFVDLFAAAVSLSFFFSIFCLVAERLWG